MAKVFLIHIYYYIWYVFRYKGKPRSNCLLQFAGTREVITIFIYMTCSLTWIISLILE